MTILKNDAYKKCMPVLFVGHGSPMNAIEQNEFTLTLQKLGRKLPRPKVVLCISAHWLTSGTFVNISPKPKMIYDMYGFPDELYRIEYPAPGSPTTAQELVAVARKSRITPDNDWGFDHGNWSVMKWLFPEADIPVFQISIDYKKPMRYHYELAQELSFFREKDVLIISSGNLTHNLRVVDFSGKDAPVQDWALEFDSEIKSSLDDGNHDRIIDYESHGTAARLTVPEPSHFIPLIYAIGLQHKDEPVSCFYEKFEYGTLSMRSLIIGSDFKHQNILRNGKE